MPPGSHWSTPGRHRVMELDEGGPPIVHPGPVQRPHKYTGAQQVSDSLGSAPRWLIAAHQAQ